MVIIYPYGTCLTIILLVEQFVDVDALPLYVAVKVVEPGVRPVNTIEWDIDEPTFEPLAGTLHLVA